MVCLFGASEHNPGGMLKKFPVLTRPTPARQDAPFREQGHSE